MARTKTRGASDRRHHWAGVISEWEQSGSTQVGFCRERGIAIATFRWWRSRLNVDSAPVAKRRSTSDTTWVPVTLSDGVATASAIEVVVAGGRIVRIPGPISEELLQRVIAAAECAPCSR